MPAAPGEAASGKTACVTPMKIFCDLVMLAVSLR
jgi:hypothetical protein